MRLALVAVILLGLADAGMRLTFAGRHQPQDSLLWAFDASRETSVQTWFAVVAMACVGLRCFRLGGDARPWLLLGAGFTYLSLDDACMLHERIGEALAPRLSGFGVYSWVLALGALFAVGGIAAFAWLWRRLGNEPERRRPTLAGFVALGVALAIEVVEDKVIRSGATLRGIPLVAYTSCIEETLEMLGPVLLLLGFPEPRSCTDGRGLAPQRP